MLDCLSQVWVEKYRPTQLEEYVDGSINKDLIKKFIDNPKDMPHLLLVSKSAGTGKTSLAQIMINSIDTDSIILNSSMDRGIDMIRERVNIFASTSNRNKDLPKIVFLDESDGMCLDGNTLVKVIINDIQKDVPIKELVGTKFLVFSLNGFKKFEMIESTAVQNKEKEMFEIELFDGKKVICSEDHKFFKKIKVKNGREHRLQEICLKDIKEGDEIVDLSSLEVGKNLHYCRECGQAFLSIQHLSWHINRKHENISKKEYYDKYLKKENEGTCVVCKKETKFKSINKGYKICCSQECYNKNNSLFPRKKGYTRPKDVIKKIKNKLKGRTLEDIHGTVKANEIRKKQSMANKKFRASEEGKKRIESNKKKQSIYMKRRIKNGEFTPARTNSWTHWRDSERIKGKTYKFRSSWEHKFFNSLLSLGYSIKDIGYEKIRLPYLYNNDFHNYLVDFVIYSMRLLIEIKPKSEKSTIINKIKHQALINYAKKNKYNVLYLDEDTILHEKHLQKIKETIDDHHR